ncbi:hypothetical protein AUJ77_03050 [Candidatus Nomurabacteria bacterium CG1_02_43_90]|uniref:DUF5666 domain-containing protein n=1 Tax=Candidatus Nomurabacteria bacterium CG1_02_43_90 TaxID=1805281 RepID=A0A1J4V8C9_9BACT|nr:MAG: hypothetical protein AUJ77_03050 [Candidatus Nomurabacteria bacterium CG1_02_43_90]
MKNKKSFTIISGVVLGLMLLSGVAFVQAAPQVNTSPNHRTPGVYGTVSAVIGTTLTVTSRGFKNKDRYDLHS